jgi:hypothetical protein
MKWFRANLRLLSQLALFALAVQFPLSFGHFHGSATRVASASVEAESSGLRSLKLRSWGLENAAGFAAVHLHAATDRTSRAHASQLARPNHLVSQKTSSDHEPDGQPTNECAVCAVMALTNAWMLAAPPYLLGPQARAFSYLISEGEFVDLNSARVAFQPRAPPIS